MHRPARQVPLWLELIFLLAGVVAAILVAIGTPRVMAMPLVDELGGRANGGASRLLKLPPVQVQGPSDGAGRPGLRNSIDEASEPVTIDTPAGRLIVTHFELSASKYAQGVCPRCTPSASDIRPGYRFLYVWVRATVIQPDGTTYRRIREIPDVDVQVGTPDGKTSSTTFHNGFRDDWYFQFEVPIGAEELVFFYPGNPAIYLGPSGIARIDGPLPAAFRAPPSWQPPVAVRPKPPRPAKPSAALLSQGAPTPAPCNPGEEFALYTMPAVTAMSWPRSDDAMRGDLAIEEVQRALCGELEVLGRTDGEFTLGGGGTNFSGWLLVQKRANPDVWGWIRVPSYLSPAEWQPIPSIDLDPQHPDGLPDLRFGDIAPALQSGDRCAISGMTVEARWHIWVRNEGPATGPRSITILVKETGEPDRRFTVKLLRGLEPGEELRVTQATGRSQVIVDPDGEVAEADEGNNTLTPPQQTLRCGI